MLIKSALLTDASGSIGGLTASHNRGGLYLRARKVPTNPGTSFQETVRAAVSQLSNLWLDALTVAQREAWNNYAAQVTIPNALGDPIHVSGLNMYVRSNAPALQAGLGIQDDAPTILTLGEFSPPSFVPTAAADTASITFEDTDPWLDETGSAMLVYFSRAKNPTVNFHKGPYRFAGTILGDDTTPPTSPQVLALPFPVEVGQRIFGRFNVLRADGRLASPFRTFGVGV